jgi:lysophospholipase L1-like esterase
VNRIPHLVCLIVCCGLAWGAWAEEELVIAHFGDSTCATIYLLKEQRVDALLNAKLSEKYKGQKIRNVNLGLDGDFIRQFIDNGRYEKVKVENPKIDIALIRYGMNDWKKLPKEEQNKLKKADHFSKHLEELCDKLLADYPGINIVLETNTYVCLKHSGDMWMNDHWNLYWQAARELARDRKYSIVDIQSRYKKEIDDGNWDFFIRNQVMARKKFGSVIVDSSKDDEMKSEGVAWFSDGHPNFRGVTLIADEEFKTITERWPTKLPASDSATKR